MKQIVKTQTELNGLNREELISLLKNQWKVSEPLSRVKKDDLVSRVLREQQNQTIEKSQINPVNKSALLRKELRKRARANQEMNSGELVSVMKEEYGVEMTQQFIVNVRGRFFAACPELLKA